MAVLFAKGSKFDPRVKPRQWGSISAVQYAVRRNCEKLGLPLPVGYWPLWEGSGKYAWDLSGNGNRGALTNGPAWTKGVLYFDGQDDYVSIPHSSIYDFTGSDPFTFSARLYADTQTARMVPISKYDDTADLGYKLWGILDLEGYAAGIQLDAGTDDLNIYAEDALPYGRWVHVIWRSKGTESAAGLDIFYDGVLQPKIIREDNGTGAISNSANLNLGMQPGDGRYLEGKLDNVYCTNYALNASQAELLAEQPYAMLQPVSRPVFFDMGALTGTVTWGHDTDVTEENIRDFEGNWTGTGEVSGSGDEEVIALATGQYMESETWNIGSGNVRLRLNVYAIGDNAVIYYKQGDTEANCEADTWHLYSAPFACAGWIKVRVENE